jgi:hypothetical protein
MAESAQPRSYVANVDRKLYSIDMTHAALPNCIPDELARFFWDVDARKLNPSAHPQYVINRLLDKGDLLAARWVLSTFSAHVIKHAIIGSRDFSAKSAVFWGRYLGIALEDFKCMQQPYQRMHSLNWVS